MNNNYFEEIVDNVVSKKERETKIQRYIDSERKLEAYIKFLKDQKKDYSNVHGLLDKIHASRELKRIDKELTKTQTQYDDTYKQRIEAVNHVDTNPELDKIGSKFIVQYGDIVSGAWRQETVEAYSYQYGIEDKKTEHIKLESLKEISDISTVLEYIGSGRFKDLTTGVIMLAAEPTRIKRYEMDGPYDPNVTPDYYYYTEEELLESPLAIGVDSLKTAEDAEVLTVVSNNQFNQTRIMEAMSAAYVESRALIEKERNTIRLNSVSNAR